MAALSSTGVGEHFLPSTWWLLRVGRTSHSAVWPWPPGTIYLPVSLAPCSFQTFLGMNSQIFPMPYFLFFWNSNSTNANFGIFP